MDTEVVFSDNECEQTLVVFTGVQFGNGPLEFYNLSKEYNVLFVTDKKRSWYNELNIAEIKKYLNGAPVITIGNSMGGHSAIQFANEYPVKVSIAFTPQYSVHPDVVSDNCLLPEWIEYRNEIKNWKYKHLQFNDKTKYFLLFGNIHAETCHSDLVPVKKNISLKNFDAAHDIASHLKERGVLYDLIHKMINNQSFDLTNYNNF